MKLRHNRKLYSQGLGQQGKNRKAGLLQKGKSCLAESLYLNGYIKMMLIEKFKGFFQSTIKILRLD